MDQKTFDRAAWIKDRLARIASDIKTTEGGAAVSVMLSKPGEKLVRIIALQDLKEQAAALEAEFAELGQPVKPTFVPQCSPIIGSVYDTRGVIGGIGVSGLTASQHARAQAGASNLEACCADWRRA